MTCRRRQMNDEPRHRSEESNTNETGLMELLSRGAQLITDERAEMSEPTHPHSSSSMSANTDSRDNYRDSDRIWSANRADGIFMNGTKNQTKLRANKLYGLSPPREEERDGFLSLCFVNLLYTLFCSFVSPGRRSASESSC